MSFGREMASRFSPCGSLLSPSLLSGILRLTWPTMAQAEGRLALAFYLKSDRYF